MEDELPKASGRGPILVKPETWELMRRKLQDAQVDFDLRDFAVRQVGKRKVVSLLDQGVDQVGGGSSNSATAGGFCEIFQDGEGDWFLRGGVVTAGVNSHQVDDFQFLASPDGEKLFWLEVAVVANVEDEVLMPGLASSTMPTVETGSAYAAAEMPVAPTGEGTAIVPLGKVVITDGVPVFSPAGNCSPVQIGHCPGTLSYD